MSPDPGRRRVLRVLVWLLFPLLTSAVLYLPWRPLAAERRSLAGVRLTDRAGRLLYCIPGAGGAFTVRLAREEVPLEVRRIFVRLEDRRFLHHRGVDLLAATRAAADNLARRRVVSGASTITMQAARLLAPHGGGLAGKVREILGAVRLETALDKDQILLLYLNLLPFGHNTLGAGAAAIAYFDRPLAELSPAQILLLATLPKAPAAFDPFRGPRALRAKALALAPLAGILAAEVEAAMLTLRRGRPVRRAPHFLLYIQNELPRLAASRAGGRQIARVTTTLDLALQEQAAERLDGELTRAASAVRDASVLVLDNDTGEVLAYLGGTGAIDAVRTRSPSGSTLKPFLYALALERGWTCADLLPDLALSFGGEASYRPENFDRRSRGVVRLRAALAGSLNVPAVYLLSRLGLQSFLQVCGELGLDLGPAGRIGLGAAIGNASVSLLELTRAFSVFPRGGSLPPLRLVRDLRTVDGQRLEVTADGSRRVFSPETSWLVRSVLSDSSARATGFGTRSRLNTPFPAMFKSGTASGYHSLWCVGATAERTVGVWAGNLDRRAAYGVTGSSLPAAVVRAVLEGSRVPGEPDPAADVPPPGLRSDRICTLTGFAASPGCPSTRLEHFRPAALPRRTCPVHTGGVSLEALAMDLFLEGSPGPRFLFPRSGTIFYTAWDLPAGRQTIRAWVARRAGEEVQIRVNGAAVALPSSGELNLPVAPGRYRLEAIGAAGRDAVTYEVR